MGCIKQIPTSWRNKFCSPVLISKYKIFVKLCKLHSLSNAESQELQTSLPKALILPYPTLTTPGTQSVQLAVHKLCCTLESPGEIFKILMPSYHPIAIKSEYLWIGGRKQYFYRSLGDSGKVWELAPLCTALFMLMPCPGGTTV